jgi:hypothetical protein
MLQPRYFKGQIEQKPVYERWNAYSRIAVWTAGTEPIGWGMSSRFRPQRPVEQLWLNIDASAGTVMTRFDGDLARLDFLGYDVTNLVHYIRPDARVLVIGSGGGRDVLSALYFRQREVVGVEINEAILEAVNGRFGEFTGHLDRRRDVRFVNADARSYLARTDAKFDVIQASLIDTWAATAAGAYVLTENGLYTVEAWQRMLERLSDRGVITFSRWYSADGPGELYRLTALAVAALRRSGVAAPSEHLMIVHRPHDPEDERPTGIATLLAARRPFSAEDIETVERVAQQMAFGVLLSPRTAADDTLRRLAFGDDFEAFVRDYPINIAPPTDDRPFFFHMVRLRDVWHEAMEPGMAAIATLGMLLVTVVVLTGLCVIVPLALTFRSRSLAGALPLLVYFSSIGLGFMLIEIALIERLNLFLGHPIYSMTVVLFCLLLAAGCGSWLSGVLVKNVVRGTRGPACLIVLCGAVVLAALGTGPLLHHFDALPVPGRIALAVGILLPLGLVMGTGFPLGMRAAYPRAEAFTPWLFGVNGATSICGAVVAVVISLSLGITATLLGGAACYLVALTAFVWATRFGTH